MKTKQLGDLMRAGDTLASIMDNPRMEWQTAKTFLLLAVAGGEMPMQELEKLTGLGQSSVSRNVARLGIGESLAVRGPGLVEAYEDPAWRRRKLVRLTARGKAVAKQLMEALA
jgi:DNA-binding MarR family transcriptional regulator